MELRSIILQYLYHLFLPMLLTGTWIPTVFRPRSEHFPDSYGIHTGMHHVWVLWISMSNKGKNHVKLGIPISYINLWFQNELHKDSHLQNK